MYYLHGTEPYLCGILLHKSLALHGIFFCFTDIIVYKASKNIVLDVEYIHAEKFGEFSYGVILIAHCINQL